MTKSLILGITGGSGAAYADRLLRQALALDAALDVIVSPNGRRVFAHELDVDLGASPDETAAVLRARCDAPPERLRAHAWDDLAAPPASGSARFHGMVIAPCSMSTLAALSTGRADDLITRAGAVMLKERRPLVVVPRETPLSLIHLRGMLTLTEAGAVVLPAMPGFYHKPQTVDDLLDFIAARILDALGLEHDVIPRWDGVAD